MHVFVTGATGLLGSNVVAALEAAGHAVTGLVRSRTRAAGLLPDSSAELVEGDLSDIAGFSDALRGCDAVCHTAAYHREFYTSAKDHAAELERLNVAATRQILQATADAAVSRFVHIGSCGAVGMQANGEPGVEDTPPLPIELGNAYFASKLRADKTVAAFAKEHARPAVVTIIPAWMLGPGDAAPSPGGRMILDFIARKVPGVTDGGQCVVDARDVANAVVAALERGAAGRYIVAGQYRTIAEIFATLERVTGVKGPTLHLPHGAVMLYAFASELFGRLTGRPVLVRPASARALHAKLSWSSEKARRDLDITFRPLDDTLRDAVLWFRAHGMARAA